MLDKKVVELLNQQVNKEFYSAYLYLDFSNYYSDEGLSLIHIYLACQYSYYYASLIGNGHAKIVEETYKKKETLGKIMEHQTGKIFDESEMNPKLVESVTVLKINLDTYTCKRHSKNK